MAPNDGPTGGHHTFTPISHPELTVLGSREIHTFLCERERYLLRIKDANDSGNKITPISIKYSIETDLLLSLIDLGELGDNVTSIDDVDDDFLREWLRSKDKTQIWTSSLEDIETAVEASARVNEDQKNQTAEEPFTEELHGSSSILYRNSESSSTQPGTAVGSDDSFSKSPNTPNPQIAKTLEVEVEKRLPSHPHSFYTVAHIPDHERAKNISDEHAAALKEGEQTHPSITTDIFLYKVGDHVLTQRVAKDRYKLRVKWHGPLRITKVLSDFVFECQDLITFYRALIHSNRQKFYTDSMPDAAEKLLNTAPNIYFNLYAASTHPTYAWQIFRSAPQSRLGCRCSRVVRTAFEKEDYCTQHQVNA